MDIRIAGAWSLSLIVVFWLGIELEQWRLGRLELLDYSKGGTFVSHGVSGRNIWDISPTPTPSANTVFPKPTPRFVQWNDDYYYYWYSPCGAQ